MKKPLAARRRLIHPRLPIILVVLFCLQPVLDILSYWQDALHIPFSLSFVPRTAILIALFLGGYALSDRKKYYWILTGVLAVFFAGHVYACYTNGYISIVEDTSNFIRVLQLPITTFAMITCLRCNAECYEAIWRGIVCSLIILAVSFVVSTSTGTEPMTYPDQNVGVRGYSFWPNAQSAILSLSAPIAIGWALKKYQKTIWDMLLCFALTTVALAVLYVHGTRLSYACMLMASLGMAIVVFITGQAPKRYGVMLLGFTAIGIALLFISPVSENQEKVDEAVHIKSDAAENLYILGEAQMQNGVSYIMTSNHLVERGTGLEAFALPDPLTTSVFTDVKPNDWRSEYLAYCQTMGLIGGINSVYAFLPNESMTVLQAVCIADNVYERYHGVRELDDYVGDTWFEPYLKRAEIYGLIPEGVDDMEEQPLTRAEAAWLIYKALDSSAFPQTRDVDMPRDVTPDTPYAQEITTLFQAGLITGHYPSEYFRPSGKITRGDFIAMLASAIHPDFRICDEGYTPLSVAMPKIDLSGVTDEMWVDGAMNTVYSHFINGLVSRFGLRTVLKFYDYSLDTETLISEREFKLQFCRMLMAESTPISRLFGLEVSRMIYGGTSYDVENDFHGIYFLYGWVGLALLVAFLGYFAWLILRALFRDFKRYFTLESGAVGIALVASLVHAYFTCGVLRRANTLFYCAGLLAMTYYLFVLKKYPDREECKTSEHADGGAANAL